MADLILTLDQFILLFSTAGSGIARGRSEWSLCASVRETQTPSTSTNRYIRRKDSRTEASAISTRSCSPRTSTWLPGFDCLVDRNISRIAKSRELTILLFAGAICFSFSLLISGSWHSSLLDRGDSRISLLCSPPLK